MRKEQQSNDFFKPIQTPFTTNPIINQLRAQRNVNDKKHSNSKSTRLHIEKQMNNYSFQRKIQNEGSLKKKGMIGSRRITNYKNAVVELTGYAPNMFFVQPKSYNRKKDQSFENKINRDNQQLDKGEFQRDFTEIEQEKNPMDNQYYSTPHNMGMIGSLTVNTKPNRRIISSSSHKNNVPSNSQTPSNKQIKTQIKKVIESSNHLSFVNATQSLTSASKDKSKFNSSSVNYPSFIDSINNYYVSVKNSKNKVKKQGSRYQAKRKTQNSLKNSLSLNKAKNIQDMGQTNHEFFSIVGIRPLQIIRTFDCRVNTQEEKQDQPNATRNRKSVMSAMGLRKSLKSPSLTKQRNIDSFCFGKITDLLTNQQVTRLKILYYKDLIWKVSFNQGMIFKVQYDSRYFPRYFVGPGNNSRLIKTIMNKRWWWTCDSKEQNANFVWTQLKYYSVYTVQQKRNLCSELFVEQQQEQDKDTFILKVKKASDKSQLLLKAQKFKIWKKYISKDINSKKEKKAIQCFPQRIQLQKGLQVKTKFPQKVSNHLQFSKMIGNKKALYRTMKKYQSQLLLNNAAGRLAYIPLTFHVSKGLEDPQYTKFLKEYYQKSKQSKQNFWIVKPGENSNQGNGITVCSNLNQIKYIIKKKQTHGNGQAKSFIVQQYIVKPFLYKERKFDIRHYIMITCFQGNIRGYYYAEGYIRTTSYKYSLQQNSQYVHLTNDYVQKFGKDYGKYQKGNKLSYEQFQKYLKENYPNKYSFKTQILPKIRQICTDVIKASFDVIDPNRRMNNFEIFGLDIMIDQNFDPWLIQVNTNPCLELSSPVLAKVIPRMVDNAFTIAIDPLFPPPSQILSSGKRITLPQNYVEYNRFQLVFDESQLKKKFSPKGIAKQEDNGLYKDVKDDDEAFESNDDEYDAQY